MPKVKGCPDAAGAVVGAAGAVVGAAGAVVGAAGAVVGAAGAVVGAAGAVVGAAGAAVGVAAGVQAVNNMVINIKILTNIHFRLDITLLHLFEIFSMIWNAIYVLIDWISSPPS